MKLSWLGYSLFLTLFTQNLFAQSSSCRSLQDLHWILGAWQSVSDKQTIQENWLKNSDKTFEGEGKTMTSKGTFVETLRLVEMSQQVFYLAKIANNPLPVAFKAEACSHGHAKFINPQHDFPTSLDYRLKSKHHLVVEVRGADGKGFDIDFVKDDE